MCRIITIIILLYFLVSPVLGAPQSNQAEALLQTATTTEVTFPGDDLTLSGTLYLPQRTGPTPAVVLVHGSGPNDRREVMSAQLNMGFGFDIPVFEELATALQNAGIAVLIYDKRTCFPGNGCADNGYPAPDAAVSVLDFAADATSALEFLSVNDNIEPSQLFIVGHSQGGQLVPEILSRFQSAAGGVVLAGNISPVDELLLYQVNFTKQLLEESGMAPNQITASVMQLKTMADGVAAVRTGSHGGSPIGGTPAAFWKSWIDLSAAIPAQVEASDARLLVLGGSYDWNVPPSEIDKWQELFDSLPASRASASTRILPCITHALNCVAQPNWQKIQTSDIGKSVDNELIQVIVEFVKNSN